MKTFLVGMLAIAATSVARADVFNMGPGLTSLEFVTVGDPGNVGDWSNSTGYGSVAYPYRIGRYEVTAGQYAEFLNAKAKDDPYGLYNRQMWTHDYGCKIDRSGPPGNYAYSVAPDRANRPVDIVTWGSAARFVNWLHNGQGGGSTETGAYALNGATSDEVVVRLLHASAADYWIPTEDEWYKAAYYDPSKPGGPGYCYWDYPTRSDYPNVPSNRLRSPDPGNSANFNLDGRLTLNKPYYTTEVGAFANSAGPWGTYDQGGNVREWNETIVLYLGSTAKGTRGGVFSNAEDGLASWTRSWNRPGAGYGFRVASSVPEPSGLILLLTGVVLVGRRARGARSHASCEGGPL